MMAGVWGIGRDELPGFWHRLLRGVGFLAVLGVGFIGAGALAGLGAFGGLGGYSVWIGLVGSLAINIAMYWFAFQVLLAIPRPDRNYWPGALFGGSIWTILQFVGAQLVAHQLKHLSALYGTFATVLGLMSVGLALGATVSVATGPGLNVVVVPGVWLPVLPAGQSDAADGRTRKASPPRRKMDSSSPCRLRRILTDREVVLVHDSVARCWCWNQAVR